MFIGVWGKWNEESGEIERNRKKWKRGWERRLVNSSNSHQAGGTVRWFWSTRQFPSCSAAGCIRIRCNGTWQPSRSRGWAENVRFSFALYHFLTNLNFALTNSVIVTVNREALAATMTGQTDGSSLEVQGGLAFGEAGIHVVGQFRSNIAGYAAMFRSRDCNYSDRKNNDGVKGDHVELQVVSERFESYLSKQKGMKVPGSWPFILSLDSSHFLISSRTRPSPG